MTFLYSEKKSGFLAHVLKLHVISCDLVNVMFQANREESLMAPYNICHIYVTILWLSCINFLYLSRSYIIIIPREPMHQAAIGLYFKFSYLAYVDKDDIYDIF